MNLVPVLNSRGHDGLTEALSTHNTGLKRKKYEPENSSNMLKNILNCLVLIFK